MAAKSDKEKKITGKVSGPGKESEGKSSPKPKKQVEEDDDDLDDSEETDTEIKSSSKKETKAVASSKKGKVDDDDEETGGAEEEVVDDWDKVEEEDNWDPDFEEFDLPKSKAKKTGGKKATEEEDDFKVDDEFKDMFNDSDGFGDEEDDF